MKKLILFIIFILIIFSFFFFWRRIEETVKTWEDIEIEDIILKEDLEEKTIEDIVQEIALFDNSYYYVEDLNKNGFLELLAISLSEEKDTAHFVLVSVVNNQGAFEQRGSFVLERNFIAIPSVLQTRDIIKNNIKEIIIDLQVGGVATQTHAILEWKDGLQILLLEDEKKEKKQAIFLIGGSAMHHQIYYLKDEQIIEVNAWTETDQELNCSVRAYKLKNNIFSYSQELSEEIKETIKDDCLLEND